MIGHRDAGCRPHHRELCDQLGLDTIETGAAIAIYMDAGRMAWGDAEGAKKLVAEIAEGLALTKL